MSDKHKVFTSYHHTNDQSYKEFLLRFNERYGIFIDRSVDTGDIDESLSDQVIREKIRDDYLQDSTVTMLLLGQETKNRKHIDWELYSSMIDGKVNKRSGIIVINLPTIREGVKVSHQNEKQWYPGSNWVSYSSRKEHETAHPSMPERIIDNLCVKDNPPKISITDWDTIINNPEMLRWLINKTFEDRYVGDYDLRRPMKERNSFYRSGPSRTYENHPSF